MNELTKKDLIKKAKQFQDIYSSNSTAWNLSRNRLAIAMADFVLSLKPEQPSAPVSVEHTSCDGCAMMQDNGCMLDVSVCPDCFEHSMWTPKSSQSQSKPEPIKTAEEILEYYWGKPQMESKDHADIFIKNMALKAMQEYRNQPDSDQSEKTVTDMPTDEEITKWNFEYLKDIYNNLLPNEGDSISFDGGDFQLWQNLMLETGRAVRDGLIKGK